MKELAQTLIYHVERAAKKAGVNFDADCRAELEAVFEAADDRITRLEARVQRLVEEVRGRVR
jgi:hypothetical protein